MRRVTPRDTPTRLGQLFWIGLRGTTVDRAVRSLLRQLQPGGLILFARNIENARQVRSLTDALRRSIVTPPFIALDQEGGRVNRLRGITGPAPASFDLARRPNPAIAVRRYAEATARVLKSLGFNVNFAPVLDLSDPSMENGVGDRAFGEDPRVVAPLAGLLARIHCRAGVIPVGKHFPGLGSARVDSHEALPVIRRSRATLLRRDIEPYRRLRRVLPIVMIGHAYYPSVQGPAARPASLSPAVVNGLLRSRVAYAGLALTDDLEMGAIDADMNGGQRALAALEAGNDGLMFCHSADTILEAYEAIRSALETGDLAASRLEVSLRRVSALKARYLLRRRRGGDSAGAIRQARRTFEALGAPPSVGLDPTDRA